MNPVEAYLTELRDIRASGGVPETSGYPALSSVLNEIGHKLKPKVRCTVNPKNAGAGIPDGGLFTPNQFPKGEHEPLPGQLPARGAIEVKPTSDDAHAVARSEQALRYLEKYRQVLVTTYREFVLVGFDLDGAAQTLESFSLAPSEVEFWALAAHPGSADARAVGERLTEFLCRAMLRQAPIAAPQDLAWFLASYAREARARAEERDLPALATTREGLEESLGMTFSGEKGDHFFRSTLVQTLFYGLFAAWVFWSEHHPPTDAQARFRWREAAGYLHIPILQKLFYDFANPSQLGALKLDEVLDWAAEAMNRVDRASFFDRFEQSHAVQYFYEPFLEAFDPELRKELGVWYTPPEIVQYMVARVDTVLREELDIPDGLADPRVVVLDPCCGTGAYLVEVLAKIAATLRDKGDDALIANDLKQAARTRIFGFEILPAPFVISHLQIGMLLHRLGAPFADESDERAGVYLTNALTGWDPPKVPKQHLLFHEMEEERDKAEAVKQHQPILVILGNPPYNGFAGVSPQEEGGLVEPYKEGLASQWGVRKYNLDDLYVRFFRIAERRIVESGRGVVCLITNYSYVSDPSFAVMRRRLFGEFETITIDCMNGDSRETGKLCPDGTPDPSVFSTAGNREGIRLGTAIGTFVKRHNGAPASVAYRDFWGSHKLEDLVGNLTAAAPKPAYEYAAPEPNNRFSLRPLIVSAQYRSWPALTDLCAAAPISGLQEMRRGALVDIDRDRLEPRMAAYFDGSRSWESLAGLHPGLLEDAGRFDAKATRTRALEGDGFSVERIRRYALYPFDSRWAYWSPIRPLWNEPRPALVAQAAEDNWFFIARAAAERPHENLPVTATSILPDYHLLRPNVVAIPAWIGQVAGAQDRQQALAVSDGTQRRANLSAQALAYLAAIEFGEPDDSVWHHALAVGHSPAYLKANGKVVRADWPRIPLPATRDALLASADLGHTVAGLLDVEEPVDAVTTGSIRYELRPIASIAAADDRQINPAAGDLAVTAGWGHAGQGGVTMPGRGRLQERPWTQAELAQLREGAASLGMTLDRVLTCLGETTFDIFLNDVAYWRCVPALVWKYTIGGYQVMKKWLSYRERPLLGRDLKPDEARYGTEMARRIAAILLLEPALDANYERVKADTYAWPGPK